MLRGLARGVNRYSQYTTPLRKWRPRPRQLVNSYRTVCVECYSSKDFVYVPLPPSINLKHLNLKSESDRRKTYETWRVAFMDANQLAAAGFYFTNQCGIDVEFFVQWKEATGLKEMVPWSIISAGVLSCSFTKGLCVGSIPILSKGQPQKSPELPTRSRHVCGAHFKLRPSSLPERTKYYKLYFLF